MVAARSELLGGDHRLLYLAWLMGIQRQTESRALTYDDATGSAGCFMSINMLHELDG
jgi:hypothetical protein